MTDAKTLPLNIWFTTIATSYCSGPSVIDFMLWPWNVGEDREADIAQDPDFAPDEDRIFGCVIHPDGAVRMDPEHRRYYYLPDPEWPPAKQGYGRYWDPEAGAYIRFVFFTLDEDGKVPPPLAYLQGWVDEYSPPPGSLVVYREPYYEADDFSPEEYLIVQGDCYRYPDVEWKP